jgi:hypothetical protein
MTTTFSIDINERQPLRDIWRFGANTCDAPLWMRSDLRWHLELAARDLRFEYVRANNIFSDCFDIVRSDGNFSWDRVLEAFDGILVLGLKPFVELSSYPAALVDATPNLLAYDFKTRPPREWNDWYRLVRDLVENLAARYGHEELKNWYFEVWNEPDIGFWSGTQAEYFRLYDLAAQAVKEVDSEFRIGGPATSKTAWIDAFLEHIQTPSADFVLKGVSRCDFVSTHAYPSDLAFLPAAHGEVELQNSTIMRELFTEVRRRARASPFFVANKWRAPAFGMTEARTVQGLSFAALPGVQAEVDGIAAHFYFQPTGDGTPLFLTDLKNLRATGFRGMDLLTLSACDTATRTVGQVGDGREVEGFAALAQQKGAGAVLTTLWPVNDAFTSGLMRQFYSLGKAKSTPGNVTGKAEALREAQVALLSGFLQGVPGYAPQRQPR